jgi:hypothetical protein
LRFPLLGVLALVLAGCGHPATKEECEAIFRRSAEIALKSQNVTDPAEVEKHVAEAREAKGKAMVDECLGKRITEKAMVCVNRAETSADLDRCLQ